MKLKLPHREVNLDATLAFEERNSLIFKLLEEMIEFHEMNMTVEEYFRFTWNKDNTKICMDIIGYYLTKNNTEGEDREVLSKDAERELRKGSKDHVTFSGMGYQNQVSLGVIDEDDYTN